MARNEKTYTVTEEGRDNGKVFLIREMPASQAETWAIRALMAISKNSPDVLENAMNMDADDAAAMGMAGIASLGFKALGSIPFADAGPLLAEMMDCVQFIPDPTKPNVVRRLIEDDIQEIKTRIKLRMEVLKLHTDFS